MYSSSFSETQTFTITHAKHLAAKVATDLKRMQRFYGVPSDSRINDYETEITELLKKGYLKKVSYGFMKDGNFIEPTLNYTAQELEQSSSVDDDPGKIRPGANVDGASFHSFLTYSDTWFNLSLEERARFENGLPFSRSTSSEPGISGYLDYDKTYTSGGRSLNRSTIKNY